MRHQATALFVALWIAGCGGPMGEDGWDSEDVSSQTFAQTSYYFDSHLCSSCKFNDSPLMACVGNATVDDPLDLKCVPLSSSCQQGQFRQCQRSDCTEWQLCGADGSWAPCEDLPPVGTTDAADHEYRTYANFEGLGKDFSCTKHWRTPDNPDDPENPDGKPDLRPSFASGYPKIKDGRLYVEGEVCNRGDKAVDESTDLRFEFASGLDLSNETVRGAIGRLDARGGRSECYRFDRTFDLDDDLDEGRYKVTVIADAGRDIDEGSSGEDNNEIDRSLTFNGTESETSSGESLRLKSLSCSSEDDGDKIECTIRVCLDPDELEDADDVKVGVYFDQKREPGCGEEPDKGSDFRLSNMKGDDDDECREKTVSWNVDDEDEDSFKVYSVVDIDCDFLDEGDSDRARSDSVKMEGKEDDDDDDDDDDKVVESSACQLGGSPVADLPPLLLLALFALIRRRRR